MPNSAGPRRDWRTGGRPWGRGACARSPPLATPASGRAGGATMGPWGRSKRRKAQAPAALAFGGPTPTPPASSRRDSEVGPPRVRGWVVRPWDQPMGGRIPLLGAARAGPPPRLKGGWRLACLAVAKAATRWHGRRRRGRLRQESWSTRGIIAPANHSPPTTDVRGCGAGGVSGMALRSLAPGTPLRGPRAAVGWLFELACPAVHPPR